MIDLVTLDVKCNRYKRHKLAAAVIIVELLRSYGLIPTPEQLEDPVLFSKQFQAYLEDAELEKEHTDFFLKV